jgi:DNA-binding response OmpR family regulator
MAKIFMSEDDPLMGRMYERAFKTSGYELETASDGEMAVSKLKAMDAAPTVIILDVMMPKMNGFDVLKAVKQEEKLKNAPVIMLTNLAGEADAEKALSLGAVLYLVKSQYDPKQIVEKVKEIISASSRTSDIPSVSVEVKDVKQEEKHEEKPEEKKA